MIFGNLAIAGMVTLTAFSLGCGSSGGDTITNNTTAAAAADTTEVVILTSLLDTTFGTSGKVTTAVGTGHDEAHAAALQSDGAIVVVGSAQAADGTTDFAIVRYLSTGAIDTTFGTDGKVTTDFTSQDDVAYAVAILDTGHILVAGEAGNGTDKDFAIAVYDSLGVLDPAYDTDGKILTDFGAGNDGARSLKVQSDGLWVAAGYAAAAGTQNMALVRYATDGTLDTAFDTDGKQAFDMNTSTDLSRSLVIDADGKFVLAGSSTDGTGTAFGIARLTTDGALDTTFNATGKLIDNFGGNANDEAFSLAIDADGYLVVAGQSINANLDNDFAIAKYSSTGALDSYFNLTGRVMSDFTTEDKRHEYGKAVILRTDGTFAVAGHAQTAAGYDYALASYVGDGSFDISFNTTGIATLEVGAGHDFVNAAVAQADGAIIVLGRSFGTTNYDFSLVRFAAP